MPLRNTERSWGWVQRALHWAVAAIILYQLAVGVWMANFVSDQFDQFALTQIHKSWGVAVFALGLVRIAWRATQAAAPARPADLKPWEAVAAKATHLGFYALMLWTPLTGWLMSSASPIQDLLNMENRAFGWALPDPWVPGDRAAADLLHSLHVAGAVALAGLLVLHVAAALKHHFLLRDDVLRRMSWGG